MDFACAAGNAARTAAGIFGNTFRGHDFPQRANSPGHMCEGKRHNERSRMRILLFSEELIAPSIASIYNCFIPAYLFSGYTAPCRCAGVLRQIWFPRDKNSFCKGLHMEWIEKYITAGHFAHIADSLDEGLFFIDADARILKTNTAFRKALGYEENEITTMYFPDIAAQKQRVSGPAQESSSDITSPKLRCFDCAEKQPVPLHFIDKRSGLVPVALRTIIFRNQEMPHVHGVGIAAWTGAFEARRIWEQQPLLESKQFLENVFSTAHDGIFVIDAFSHYVMVNDAFCEMTGYNRDELIGQNKPPVLPDAAGDVTVEQVIQPIDMHDNFIRFETVWKRKDGIIFPVDVCFTMLENAATWEYNGLVGTVRDITMRKRMEEDLLRSRDELERKVKERTESLEETNVALRVLLNKRDEDKKSLEDNMLHNVTELIMPYLEKLKAGKPDERQKVYLEIIEKNLNDLVAPLLQSDHYLFLTPTEIQVTNLIRQGKSTKEISDILNICGKTVAFHRDSIRKKLGLKKSKVSLRDHLTSTK
jgi:PAS domain S-box-containing protein